MTFTDRPSRSVLPFLIISTLGALAAYALPGQSPQRSSPAWTPALSEARVECELRDGCQQLVGLIEGGSPDAAWAVGRLRSALEVPALGPAIQAMAHRGLAEAYRTGSGTAVDAVAAAAHKAQSRAVEPMRGDQRLAQR